jgi:predicted LPLAT superfamily acyltransferase
MPARLPAGAYHVSMCRMPVQACFGLRLEQLIRVHFSTGISGGEK